MTKVLGEVMLWSSVGLALIYCLGIAQFRRAMDAVHIYSAAAMLCPLLLIVAIALSEGGSKATLKAVTVAFVLVAQSPLIAHIVGRALHEREVDRAK